MLPCAVYCAGCLEVPGGAVMVVRHSLIYADSAPERRALQTRGSEQQQCNSWVRWQYI